MRTEAWAMVWSMDLNDIQLTGSPLADGEDTRLARLIEAGVYAEHLLEIQSVRSDLQRVVDAAAAARERLWSTGMRIAMQQARRVANLNQLPPDDLFQDGCVAVAEAILRYDHERGVRFTTFVFDLVQRAMTHAVRHRIGRPVPSRWDRRAARLVVVEMEARRAEGVAHTLESAAAAVGVPITAVNRALIRMVSLDDTVDSDPAVDAPFEGVETAGLDFLKLLTARDRRILELRYGLNGRPMTLAEAAAELGASMSTVHRWEQAAIAASRRILAADRTTMPRRRRQCSAA